MKESEAIRIVDRAIREAGVKLSGQQRTNLVGEVLKRGQQGATAEQLRPLVVQAAKDLVTRREQTAQAAGTSGLTALGGTAQPGTGVSTSGAGATARTLQQPQQGQQPSAVLATTLRVAAANPPQLTDPEIAGDLGAYSMALKEWQDSLANMTTTLAGMQELELGIVRLPDGTLVDVSDPAVERDPRLQAQVAAIFANQDAKVMNDYYGILNDYDLTDFANQTARTNANNAALSTGFQNALSAIETQVSIGEKNQNTAVRDIARSISGLQESRARADQVESDLSAQQGLAGPAGKTAYGPGDFGAAGMAAARYAGLPPSPNATVINFTGQRTVDPAGLMAAGDAALGVQGPLATIPGIGVDASQVPAAPQMGMVGPAPQLRRPTAPAVPNRAVPPPPPAPAFVIGPQGQVMDPAPYQEAS